MDANATWQYAVVLLIVLFALWRMLRGLRKKNRSRKSGSCCGCALSQTCHDYKKPDDNKKARSEKPRDCCK